MIQPINQNSKMFSRLEPVQIPHFTGVVKKDTKTGMPDTFKKNVSASVNKFDKEYGPKIDKAAKTVRKGVTKGVGTVYNFGKKTVEFTGALVSSLYNNAVNVAKEKGVKTITQFSDLI